MRLEVTVGIVRLGETGRHHKGLGTSRARGWGDIVGLGDTAGAGGHCGGHGLGPAAIGWVRSPHGREELAWVSPQSPGDTSGVLGDIGHGRL